MSFFKRIFGKGNEETDKSANDSIEQVKSRSNNVIYPILKPGDWVGLKAGAISQTIVGDPKNPQLVIAFGYDTPENFVFLMARDLENKDPQKVVGQAFKNLEAVPSQFVANQALDCKVLTASGHDFSSEKILNKNFMMIAHKLLNTEEILVSIPRRRCMMVTARSVDEKTLNIFGNLHNNAWLDDSYGNAPIINALFVLKNGEIDGLINL